VLIVGTTASRRYRTAIMGLGVAIPEKVVTNHDLARMVDTSHEWIVTRTGIVERRLAADAEAASDYAVVAARRALEKAGVEARELDLIIVATVTPDMPFPSTACLVQHALGAVGAAAFDLQAGCTGFLYALAVADQFIAGGRYSRVLVIGVELLSRITDWTDRNTCVLFGDAAGAAVVGPAEEGIMAVHLGADGSGSHLLYQPAGGSRLPASHRTVERRQHYIHMNGNEVFKFAVKVMTQASLAVIRKAGLSRQDVDLLIPHQANKRIIDASAKRLGLREDQVYVNIDRYGNTSSASVPVALYEAVEGGMVREGDIVLLVAFGAGLTWGSCVLRWGVQ